MFGIILVYGVFVHLLPPVKDFVESVVSNAFDLKLTENLEMLSEGVDNYWWQQFSPISCY